MNTDDIEVRPNSSLKLLNYKVADFLSKVIRQGTTVATNALLERAGYKSALLITKGFKDLLYIGNQSRPALFDLNIKKPGVLLEKVVEVDERVTLKDSTGDPPRNSPEEGEVLEENCVRGVSGDVVLIVKPISESKLYLR